MKYVIFANFISLVLIVSISAGLVQYQRNEKEEFEALRLQYIINKATDASLAAALTTSKDLEYDYSDRRITLSPEQALSEFVDSFIFNYGYIPSDELRNEVRGSYIPVFAVAVFDGVYIAQPRLKRNSTNYPENPIQDGDWDLVFTQKIPYVYRTGGNSYALNLGANYYLTLSGAVPDRVTGTPPGLLSRESVVAEINKIISSEIAYAMDSFNENNPMWANTFYIPTALTDMTRTNPVSSESILAIVQNVGFTTIKPLSSFSVGGTRVSDRRLVSGYVRNGINYYCYSDQAANILPEVTVIDVFSNPAEAATAGFTADLVYLSN
jgi:hypothetical protein